MEEYQYVKIAQELLYKIPLEMDGKLGVSLVNESLNNFKFKQIFPWNLTVRLNYKEMDINRLPTDNELPLIENYRKILENKFNSEDKPNVLFVANICVNGESDLIWRVHNPDIIEEVLKREIQVKPIKFEFGYFMKYDIEWMEVEALINL